MKRGRPTKAKDGDVVYQTKKIVLEYLPSADEDQPWLLTCILHGGVCSFERKAEAMTFAPVPDEWCEDCMYGEGVLGGRGSKEGLLFPNRVDRGKQTSESEQPMMNLFAVLMAYVAPLGGMSVNIYDCNAHPHSTTCRVQVVGMQSNKLGVYVNGHSVPSAYDFGVRARWIDGQWKITGPLVEGSG